MSSDPVWTNVKNDNRKLILHPFQSTKQKHWILWVRQKRSIKRDIELPVAIHDVREVSVLVAYVRYHFDLKLDRNEQLK